MQSFIPACRFPETAIALFSPRVGSQLARCLLRVLFIGSREGQELRSGYIALYHVSSVLYAMHRRVTQTTAAVIPRTYSTDRLARLQDPTRVVAEATNYYGAEDIYIPRQDSSEISGYDVTTHDDDEQQHWRRLDSRGESILSGLDGPGEEELDRMRRSPESMHPGISLNRVAEEDPDPPAPPDPNFNQQLEPEDIQEAIEWELEENGLYTGESCRAYIARPPLTPRLSFRLV